MDASALNRKAKMAYVPGSDWKNSDTPLGRAMLDYELHFQDKFPYGQVDEPLQAALRAIAENKPVVITYRSNDRRTY